MENCLLLDLSLKGVALACCDLNNFKGLKNQVIMPDAQGSNGDINRFVAKLPAFDHIVVSCGPGSFTGIKVGLAWVYGYQSVSTNLHVAGLSSLHEAALELARTQDSKGPLGLIWPSTRTHGFLSIVNSETENTLKLVDTTSGTIDPSLAYLKKNNGVIYKALDWPLLEKSFLADCKIETITIAKALEFALLGMARKATQENIFKNNSPAPIYLRASTAEEKLLLPGEPK